MHGILWTKGNCLRSQKQRLNNGIGESGKNRDEQEEDHYSCDVSCRRVIQQLSECTIAPGLFCERGAPHASNDRPGFNTVCSWLEMTVHETTNLNRKSFMTWPSITLASLCRAYAQLEFPFMDSLIRKASPTSSPGINSENSWRVVRHKAVPRSV